jgi:hypothetical protein
MESPLPIVGKEFFFAGTCLPSCALATDIHITVIIIISSVSMANVLWAGRQMNRCSIPGRNKRHFLLHNFQTGSGVHSASYKIDTGDFLWGLSYRSVKLTTHLRLVPRLGTVEL